MPNWTPLAGVAQAQLERALAATPTARAAVWMRALSKVAISCLKPWPCDAAEQARLGHREAVEGERVFLHAAIAEHRDLAAGQARDRERLGLGAARLLGQQHREAAVAGLARDRCGTRMVIRSARAAWVIQVLAPVTRQSPSSRTARVVSEARSEPVLGSVKTAVGRISPEAILGR